MDTYKETKTFVFPNMNAKVHIPELTEEEKTRRMAAIKKAAEEVLRGKEK